MSEPLSSNNWLPFESSPSYLLTSCWEPPLKFSLHSWSSSSDEKNPAVRLSTAACFYDCSGFVTFVNSLINFYSSFCSSYFSMPLSGSIHLYRDRCLRSMRCSGVKSLLSAKLTKRRCLINSTISISLSMLSSALLIARSYLPVLQQQHDLSHLGSLSIKKCFRLSTFDGLKKLERW